MLNKIKIEVNKKEGKKPLFDNKICPKLEDKGRCQKCCFWNTLKKIELVLGSNMMEYYGMEVRKEDIDKLWEVKLSGCAILTEVCPDCIVDLSEPKNNPLGLIGVYDEWERLTCKPAFLTFREKSKTFYCPLCKKEYKHSEVKHLLHSLELSKAKHPKLYEQKPKKNKIK